MPAIEPHHIEIIYEEVIKNIQNVDTIIRNTKRRFDEKNLVMNNNSLSMYIQALQSMLKGEVFNRAINSIAKKYFLEQIKNDYGIDRHKEAKNAVEKHEAYLRSVQNPANEPSIKIDKKKDNKSKSKTILQTKNIILYGSPGVGKTYNHKKVVSLIENGKHSQKKLFNSVIQNQSEENIDNTFEAIKKEGRVAFITFHQSFSYEDFIEGYRPNEDGNIALEDGIFKEVSDKARKNLNDSQKSLEEISKELSFKELLNSFIELVEISINKDGKYPLSDNIYIFEIEDDAFRYKGDNWIRHSAGIRMKFNILEEMYINNVRSRQDVKHLEGLGGLAHQHATYFWALLEKLYVFKEKQSIDPAKRVKLKQKVEEKNYYLIIDEINRGNISKIFGELITLIEEDKRDSIEVTLPYSKESFKVPGNLYIIATMNSTDKSIALIDIALRRRFTFLKMQPNVELVKDEAKDLFAELNNFISEKLGSDFQIGHSYFMDYDDLDFVLDYKIVPLLEEYFFADPDSLKEAKAIIDRGVI